MQLRDSWEARGRTINTIEELISVYYSEIQVICIPRKERLNKLHQQYQKLYETITNMSLVAKETRSHARMLLNTETTETYLNLAFEHFSRTLDVPFDFISASLLQNPLPENFGGHLLNLLKLTSRIERYQHPNPANPLSGGQYVLPKPPALNLFLDLKLLIASCIILQISRSGILGEFLLDFLTLSEPRPFCSMEPNLRNLLVLQEIGRMFSLDMRNSARVH